MIQRGIAFKVSLTSTVETDLRLSTLCCPVAVYKGRRFQFILIAKNCNEVVFKFNLIIWKFFLRKYVFANSTLMKIQRPPLCCSDSPKVIIITMMFLFSMNRIPGLTNKLNSQEISRHQQKDENGPKSSEGSQAFPIPKSNHAA